MNYDLDDFKNGNQSATGKIIASFLIGASLGIAAGILLAPAAGKDTLKQIGDKGGDWRNQLNSLLGEASKFVNKYVESARSTAEEKLA